MELVSLRVGRRRHRPPQIEASRADLYNIVCSTVPDFEWGGYNLQSGVLTFYVPAGASLAARAALVGYNYGPFQIHEPGDERPTPYSRPQNMQRQPVAIISRANSLYPNRGICSAGALMVQPMMVTGAAAANSAARAVIPLLGLFFISCALCMERVVQGQPHECKELVATTRGLFKCFHCCLCNRVFLHALSLLRHWVGCHRPQIPHLQVTSRRDEVRMARQNEEAVAQWTIAALNWRPSARPDRRAFGTAHDFNNHHVQCSPTNPYLFDEDEFVIKCGECGTFFYDPLRGVIHIGTAHGGVLIQPAFNLESVNAGRCSEAADCADFPLNHTFRLFLDSGSQ